VFASYGSATDNALATGNTNLYNVGKESRKSFNISTELGVIPGAATVQFAYRNSKSGGAAGADGDNAFMIAGTYELAQNMELSLTHTSSSGSAWNIVAPVGKSVTPLIVESLF
jgi:hypothetical protein